MGKRCNQETGFTLIEVLIVLAVMGIVGTAIYNVHITGWKAWKFNQTQLNLHQEGRIAMMKMAKRVREATELRQDGNELVIKEKDFDNDTISYVRYSLANNKLYLQTDSDDSNWSAVSKQPITTEIVSDITFNGVDGDGDEKLDSVEIDLTLSDDSGVSNGQTYELQNNVHLRNAE